MAKQPHPGIKTQLAEHMMTDEAFNLYYGDPDIQTAIRQECVRWAASSIEQQQDYEQAAWGRIALCESGKATQYYITVGIRAVRSEYRKAWAKREYKLTDIECMTASEYRAWQQGCF